MKIKSKRQRKNKKREVLINQKARVENQDLRRRRARQKQNLIIRRNLENKETSKK